LIVSQVYGWGSDGHKITAQLAWNFLNSEAQQSVLIFLSTGYSLPQISTWPDSYRATPQGAWSAPCHFVDLPKGAKKVVMSRDCPNFCVIKSIQNYTQILSEEDPSQCDFTQGVEPCALEFLTHFVGDVHQPLHVSYEDDRGGNDVSVSFFGKKSNLHSVWDSLIITRWNSDWISASNFLQQFINQNPVIINEYVADTDPLDWADESFDYVLSTVYNFTDSQDIPYLGEEYYERNLPIVQQRLIAGGVRLGAFFNSLFKLSPILGQ